jgi:endo-1,4-beta-xylanase
VRPGRPARPALGLAVVLATLGAGADGPLAPAAAATRERCGPRTLARAGDACRHMLDAWARWLVDGDVTERDRRLGRATARLERTWSRAQRGNAACEAATTAGPDAVARLADDVRALTAAAGGAATPDPGADPDRPPGTRRRRCGGRLLRLAGWACRALLRAEADSLGRDPARGSAAADQARRRLESQWAQRVRRCPGDAALPRAGAALTLAADLAGDATTATLRQLAARTRIHVGAAVEPFPITADPDYGPTLAREFSSLSTENRMKWEPVHPERDRWVLGPADDLVDFAQRHDLRLRGHTLVWGRAQLPAYVREAASAAELDALLAAHVTTLVGRYAGRVAHWDVVNEPLTLLGDPGSTDALDDNVFHRLLGPGYVARALELAHAADPTARLFVNDFLVMEPGPKQDRLHRLARDLLDAGAPLHGIGLQGHLASIEAPTPAEITATVDRFAALGLDVEITELDHFALADDADALEDQRRVYRDTVAACLAAPACGGITVWGLTDGYSWLRAFLRPDAAPLLLDERYAPKPAYFGVRAALLGARLP